MNQVFTRQALELDAQQEVERITRFLREEVLHRLRKQGAVVGISGGIDSSVVLALAVHAFGAQRVVGILLPEKESSPESAELAHLLAEQYGVQTVTEDISSALEGFGCYRRRDEAVRRVFPEFEPSWKSKIVLPGNLLEEDRLNIFSLTVIKPDGTELNRRLPLQEYAQIVAASNFKQRTRMAMLYYHAELRNYAVIGTPNKNEHDLGFFVKYGDGGADVNPIAHLYKTQVYQLARYLEIPKAIQERTPTTDTYPAGSTQEEFFYRIPFHLLDLIWLGYEKQIPTKEIAEAAELTEEQVQRVIADIERKKRATQYLRAHPVHLE
ncbi:NAD(+) synthase [Anaerolinea thermophila]|uniref:NH(3)-dependent NAD(+) synthetase n=1 Tax=Anaerolinea thermophila (strain DSM 14523 / JCM 11388 / NBRC 100420 / UNI-1) TaxID=926569 RepID=E8MXF0_ANATU|nr:NAD(+) synthase [Anaerolinea thermophila]BAJ64031.1 NH(3)-dependent NAD(+) synthetase [Anaerolinea thermophila UNI-1]